MAFHDKHLAHKEDCAIRKGERLERKEDRLYCRALGLGKAIHLESKANHVHQRADVLHTQRNVLHGHHHHHHGHPHHSNIIIVEKTVI